MTPIALSSRVVALASPNLFASARHLPTTAPPFWGGRRSLCNQRASRTGPPLRGESRRSKCSATASGGGMEPDQLGRRGGRARRHLKHDMASPTDAQRNFFPAGLLTRGWQPVCCWQQQRVVVSGQPPALLRRWSLQCSAIYQTVFSQSQDFLLHSGV